MKPTAVVRRLKIVGWEVLAVGGMLSALQLLALLGDSISQPIQRFAIEGGLGVIGLSLILIGMEALGLTSRIDTSH